MNLPLGVAIIGVGWSGFRPVTPDLSYKEMMYEAATRAYADAGVDPRRDIGSFVTAAEDFHEGTSIFDEYTPDQLGAVQRPMHTISGDGLHALATAAMNILTGAFSTAVVEAHSKASNILTPGDIAALAMDPVLNRPLGFHPHFLAGLEMSRYLHESGTAVEAVAEVAAKNRRAALRNPSAAYSASITREEVLASEMVAAPLRRLMIGAPADGSIVMVLANEQVGRAKKDRAVWIQGLGWANDASALETREWARAVYAEKAAAMAYRQAGITEPGRAFDLAEVDDTYAYKELQHVEALGLFARGEAGRRTLEGSTSAGGHLPVNVSGGSLGGGHLLEASGLGRLLEAVAQLRGEAGSRQLTKARRAVVQSWRGVPTTSGAVVVLGRAEG